MKTLTNNSSKQQGFTLIELVVVIVILGILAATAAPKFIDLTSDAKKSVMEGVEGSLESAVSMVHAKALVAGKTKSIGTATDGKNFVVIDTKTYALVNGYPAAKTLGNGTGDSSTNAIGILGLVDLDTNDFTQTGGSATTQIIQYKDSAGTDCQLTYPDSAAENLRPVIVNSTLNKC
jgi:MSHA pilin protein MshA